MAGKFLNGIMNGPRRTWRQSVEPLSRGSSVRVGVTRGWFGYGRQVPGMQWGGGMNIDVERRHPNILALAAKTPTNQKLTGPAITLLGRIKKGKVAFVHLSAQDFRDLRAALVGLSTQVQNTELASLARDVLSDKGAEYEAAAASPLATSSQQLETPPPILITRMLANGQEGIIDSIADLGGISTKGGRQNQQDAVVVHHNIDAGVLSIGVFDGMGGHADGATASGLAAEKAEQAFRCGVSFTALESAHKAIFEAKQAIHSNMGSTGIIARISDNKVFVASVGDSRAIVVKADGSVGLLTKDDNLATEMKNTSITLVFPNFDQAFVADYWPGARGNGAILSQALGLESNLSQTKGQMVKLTIHTAEVELGSGDILILCSDGLYDYLGFDAFKTTIEQNKDKTPQAIAQALHDAALTGMQDKPGDNITVLVHKQPGAAEIIVDSDEASSSGSVIEILADPFIGLYGTKQEQYEALMAICKGGIYPQAEDKADLKKLLREIIEENKENRDTRLKEGAILALAILEQEETLTIREKHLRILADESNPKAAGTLLNLIREEKIALNPLLGDEPSRFQAIVMDAEVKGGALGSIAQGVRVRFEPEISAAIEASAGETDDVEIVEEEVLPPTSGPAATPQATSGQQPAPAQEDSTQRRIDDVLGAFHQDAQGRPRQGVPEALTAQADDPSTTVMVDMGPMLPTPPAPTGPLAVLLQDIGPTTNQQAIVDALMEITTDTSIVTSAQDMENLFGALTKVELTFPTDENIQGALIFARSILRARYIELKEAK